MFVQFDKVYMRANRLLIILIACFCYSSSTATNITGRVNIDDSWEPLIYLSVINSFSDLNTASYDFLIYQASIDTSGYFEITDLEIPEDPRIYRLHICKKGDPVSTIMIGGKDENFVHFIMINRDSVTLLINENNPSIQYSIISGHSANKSLRELFKLQKELNSPPEIPTNQSRQFLRDQVQKRFADIADTSSHAIIQFLAIYFVNEYFASSNKLALMKEVNQRIEVLDTFSPYYEAFLDEYHYLQYTAKTRSQQKLYSILGIIILVIIGAVVFWLILRRKSSVSITNDFSGLLSQLSVQEKRVLDLLKEGKSNKEISQELHIEVSTVKSHLNKIYSRLGVKNRKEIIHSNW